jgi:hypothetical protein
MIEVAQNPVAVDTSSALKLVRKILSKGDKKNI